uniref:50S ribosomal protein L4 n=1 Tax=Brugia timori TaxID=42155 RepID=A0A0R3Q346_9BILA
LENINNFAMTKIKSVILVTEIDKELIREILKVLAM